MHRHCIRSALSQCTEPTGKGFVQNVQRLCFSTSSTACSPTSRPPPNPSKYPKNDEPPKNRSPQASHPWEPNPYYRDTRTIYRNPASTDKGPSPNVRTDKTVPSTPTRFISPKPLKAKLIEKETKAFVTGEEMETTQEPDVELEEELVLSANYTPGTFVEIRRYVARMI